ncbi:TPA: hypothetical protein DCL30_02565 [Candidatus Peribacteria bacterium]|nr:hypothetical protein [Candidatus Peribacteria bacterium]HAS33826.1 hypothetical protein [Candidatus Peribacteria bacterium]
MSVSSHRILYVDDHLLAVDKLSGELVVRGSGEVGKLPLYDFLRKDHPGLRVLHRLDFETSGVVLFARTKAAYETVITSKFLSWVKTYRALVMGQVSRSSGMITVPLPSRGKGEVRAVTRYRVLERFANSSVVEATIETGRHHQIRRHFASIGHPLALDDLYGNRKFNRLFTHELHYRHFFLHAQKMQLPHPVTGTPLTIEAPLPKTFEEVVEKLRGLAGRR